MTHLLKKQDGFSLIELSIVLVIISFVIAALLLPLQTQRNIAFTKQTEATLENAKQALIGFAQVNGRLPCPATDTSNGIESPNGGGTCTTINGFLPSATLGIAGNNKNGVTTDGWNNQIRYAITQFNTAGGAATPDFTTIGEMNSLGVSLLNPDIRVNCSTLDSSANNNCNKDITLISNAVAVIYSLGAAGMEAGGKDENENLNNDQIFVSHEPTDNSLNGEFDHILTWISPYVLYNAMIQAGQLH